MTWRYLNDGLVTHTHTHQKPSFITYSECTISKSKCFLLSSIVLSKPHCLITWLYIPSTAAKGPLVNAFRPTFWGLECFYSNSSKNLGSLGNLGPVHESCTLFIGIHGNLGPVQVLWRSYVELCVFSKIQCIFPVFFDGEPQNSSRWSSFFGGISENGELDSGFAFLGVFLKQMIAIEIILHKVTVFKKHWYLQWFLHVPQFERWRFSDTYVKYTQSPR